MTPRTIPERLREIADQFERDRREPDKVLCAVQNLRRLATDIDYMAESSAHLNTLVLQGMGHRTELENGTQGENG